MPAAVKDEADQWTVEVNSLEELMELARVDEHGVVVSDNPPSLLIYDSYIE